MGNRRLETSSLCVCVCGCGCGGVGVWVCGCVGGWGRMKDVRCIFSFSLPEGTEFTPMSDEDRGISITCA
jgi:hypothetical protein